jgi:hypothetical protein
MSGKILWSIFIASGLFALRCGATVYHSDGSASNVQALHNSALDGDTITLPAGTFFWATTVTITKGITVIGLTTTDPVHKTANDRTIILANTGMNGNQPLLNLTTASGKSYRVSGITFRTGQRQIVNSNGMIQLKGASHAVRVDHCHFDDLAYENNNIGVYTAMVRGPSPHITAARSLFSSKTTASITRAATSLQVLSMPGAAAVTSFAITMLTTRHRRIMALRLAGNEAFVVPKSTITIFISHLFLVVWVERALADG